MSVQIFDVITNVITSVITSTQKIIKFEANIMAIKKKKEFPAKIVNIGNSYGVILSKEILGEDFEVKKGTELKIQRGKNFIKIYPMNTEILEGV